MDSNKDVIQEKDQKIADLRGILSQAKSKIESLRAQLQVKVKH